VLRLRDGAPEVAGPCGPEPWYIEIGSGDDPVEVVTRLATALMGAPRLVHSTSWRRDRGSVVLSFVVVVSDHAAGPPAGNRVTRAELARSSSSAAPLAIDTGQVLEHGLRHLAWLAAEDEVVRGVLSDEWKLVLAAYVPEPFLHLP